MPLFRNVQSKLNARLTNAQSAISAMVDGGGSSSAASGGIAVAPTASSSNATMSISSEDDAALAGVPGTQRGSQKERIKFKIFPDLPPAPHTDKANLKVFLERIEQMHGIIQHWYKDTSVQWSHVDGKMTSGGGVDGLPDVAASRQQTLSGSNSSSWYVIQKYRNPTFGQILRVEAILDAPPELVYRVLAIEVERTPEWNTDVKKLTVLEHLSANIDIVWTQSNSALRGAVSPRDFVDVQYKNDQCKVDNGFDGARYIMLTSTPYPLSQALIEGAAAKNVVRGENGPNAVIFLPVEGQPERCRYVSFVCIDLKGDLPKGIVNKALQAVMVKLVRELQKRVSQEAQKRSREPSRSNNNNEPGAGELGNSNSTGSSGQHNNNNNNNSAVPL